MKIKVVLCTENKKYVSRLLGYYESHYERLDSFDIHMFSDMELAEDYLKSHEIDVLLVDENSPLELSDYEDILGVYLVEDNSVDTLNGRKAIGKYQKADAFFKAIFSYYAEKNEAGREYRFSEEPARVYLFQNAGGGTGCTTMSMAYANAQAAEGKKVLYLNLELMGCVEHVYHAEDETDFGDILYMVKRNSSNLAMKLIASMAQDHTGVSFIKPSKNIPDILELTATDMEILLSTLKQSCSFDVIVVDKAPGLSALDRVSMDQASGIIFVLEASEISQRKFNRFVSGLELLDEHNKSRYASKIKIIFNKYRNAQEISPDISYEILGGIPFYENLGMTEIVRSISQMKLLRKLY